MKEVFNFSRCFYLVLNAFFYIRRFVILKSSLGSESVPINISSLVFSDCSGHWIGTIKLLSVRGCV